MTGRSRETTEFLTTVEQAAPDAVSACDGWTTHEVAAHVTGIAVEVSRHLAPYLHGDPVPETRRGHSVDGTADGGREVHPAPAQRARPAPLGHRGRRRNQRRAARPPGPRRSLGRRAGRDPAASGPSARPRA